jgi:hypothetical protein
MRPSRKLHTHAVRNPTPPQGFRRHPDGANTMLRGDKLRCIFKRDDRAEDIAADGDM